MRSPIAALVAAEALVRRPEAVAEARTRRSGRGFARLRLRRRPPQLDDDATALRIRTRAAI
jgi:hypothetical protein